MPLVESKDPDTPLRAWVAGCATGEEAYSVAMLLLDAVAAAGKTCPVQVFASDVDEQALETARVGTYPAGIEEDVPPEYLKRFFAKQGAAWQVGKALREAVIFSRHNLLADPPFSKLDLVSCRNVLIYLVPAAQKKVQTLFSFALNPGRLSLPGQVRGPHGVEEGLFEAVSKQKRIYPPGPRQSPGRRRLPAVFGQAGRRLAPRGKAQPLNAALCRGQPGGAAAAFRGRPRPDRPQRTDPVLPRPDGTIPGSSQGTGQPQPAGHDGGAALGETAPRRQQGRCGRTTRSSSPACRCRTRTRR